MSVTNLEGGVSQTAQVFATPMEAALVPDRLEMHYFLSRGVADCTTAFRPIGLLYGLRFHRKCSFGSTIVHTCDTFATPYLEPNFSSQANLGVVLKTGSFLSVATLIELNLEPICPMRSILANILVVSQSTISLDIVLCDTRMFGLRH